jgi:hypothetical protein
VFVTAPAGAEPMMLAGGLIAAMLFVAFVVERVSTQRGSA